MSIQEEERISHPLRRERDRKNLNRFPKACKVYDPSTCAGHPNCRECINILC